MTATGEYHRMGGPADTNGWPLICHVLQPGTLWRGITHPGLVDLGDIGIMEHTRKGIECILFSVQRRFYLPYPPDDSWVLDEHNHVRIGKSKEDLTLKLTLAPSEAN